MKKMLAYVLASAAHAMWRTEPSLSEFTNATEEHELNLAFHYASELRRWFPWLNCDFDVTKPNAERRRPDIVLHRRNTNAFNFLAIEVKRAVRRGEVEADLEKIRSNWLITPYCYHFGASVVLNEKTKDFEVYLLSHDENATPERVSSKTMEIPWSLYSGSL